MSLTIVDLFAGAGGLSCGFLQEGFNIALAVEKDAWASETYVSNHLNTNFHCADIASLPDSFFFKYKGADVVMGGPPCQGFSISASNRRDPNDPRNLLYLQFLRAVEIIKPRVVLIENVREIQKFRLADGRLLCLDIQERLLKMGFHSHILTLNANVFGVPQSRIRTFILAAKDERRLQETVANLSNQNQIQLLRSSRNLQSDFCLWDAISDLPEVEPWKVTEEDFQKYATSPKNQFQKMLRKDSAAVLNHVPMRHTPRMIERFKLLLDTSKLVGLNMPSELTPRLRGNPELESHKVYDQNHRKLDPNKPSPTITASFYSSFIHPFQPRNLTVREAARLQSFPDSYAVKGKRTTLSKKLLAKKGEIADVYLDQFNQVGNSVPPLLAAHLAFEIKNLLNYE